MYFRAHAGHNGYLGADVNCLKPRVQSQASCVGAPEWVTKDLPSGLKLIALKSNQQTCLDRYGPGVDCIVSVWVRCFSKRTNWFCVYHCAMCTFCKSPHSCVYEVYDFLVLS